MLILARRPSETIIVSHMGQRLTIHLVDIRGSKIRLGFTGPKSFTCHRSEVQEEIDQDNAARDKGHSMKAKTAPVCVGVAADPGDPKDGGGDNQRPHKAATTPRQGMSAEERQEVLDSFLEGAHR